MASMSFIKSVVMWVIRLGLVLIVMAACLNLDVFPIRLAY